MTFQYPTEWSQFFTASILNWLPLLNTDKYKKIVIGLELSSEKVFLQKLEYIHQNPVKANICNYPEEYYFSSAYFYENGVDNFTMLTHYQE